MEGSRAEAFALLRCRGLPATAAAAALVVDALALVFSGPTLKGEVTSLDLFKGRSIVLVSTNDGRPFVQKHYSTGNMQKIQKVARDAGAVWITVISSVPGKQGHADAARAARLTEERGAAPDFVLPNPDRAVG